MKLLILIGEDKCNSDHGEESDSSVLPLIDSAKAEVMTGLIGRMFQRVTAIPMVSSIRTNMKMASGISKFYINSTHRKLPKKSVLYIKSTRLRF